MVAENLDFLINSIEAARKASPAVLGPVTLIGACKNQPERTLREAIAAGLRHFGENRVQEAEAKWPALKAAYPDTTLHLIGPLQSNKAADAVALFDVIHTLDRESLAHALTREMDKQHRRPQCLIQVNTGEEPQKAGITPKDAPAFIRLCRDELKLPVVGLMCVPPVNELPAPHFAFLRTLAEAAGLKQLSMGMSDDYETAVRLGATYVRIGTALFGKRS